MSNSTVDKNIVVYVDDDLDDLDLISGAFMQYSNTIEVITFSNGLEALSYLNQLTDADVLPCLVILDINMPLINGKDVSEQLRKNKHFDDIPIILFSTSSHLSDKLFAKQHNIGFCTKPLGYDELYKIAAQLVSHCSEAVQKRLHDSSGQSLN
jgi:CheY-like chemotaxis protein